MGACAVTICQANGNVPLKPGHTIRKATPIEEKKINNSNNPKYIGQQTEIIYDAEGRKEYYIKSSIGTYNYLGLIIDYTQPFGAAEVVYGNDNSVYIKNIISEYNPMMYVGGTYVKGTLEGNIITMPVPQTVTYLPDYGYYLNMYVLKTEDGGNSYDITDDTEFTYLVEEDGSFSLQLPADNYAIGFVRSTNDTWALYSDVMQVFTPSPYSSIEVPRNVTTTEYVMTSQGNGYNVQVGFDNNDVYIVGLCDYAPSLAVKGTLKDNKITIPQDQYVGIYTNYNIVTKIAYPNPEDMGPFDLIPDYLLGPEDEEYVLILDPVTLEIYSENPDSYFCLNASLEMVDPIVMLCDFNLSPSQNADFSGTPAAPFDLSWTDAEFSPFGFSFFQFDLPNISTENTLLMSDNLYYEIFIDGERLLFEAFEYQYPGIITPTYLIPYYFNNNSDIISFSQTQRIVGIYSDATTLGVRSIYIYDGVETQSEIMTLNIVTGEVYPGNDSGVDTTLISDVVKTEYFSLDGKKMQNPAKGIGIIRQTMADGTICTRKIVR